MLAIEPEEDEAVNLTLEARIPGVRFEQDGDTARWVPPADLQGHLEPAELEADLDRSYADVLIWSSRDGTEYLLRSDTETRLEDGSPVLTTRARLQPRIVVAKADLKRGEWTVGVTASAAGFTPVGVPAIHGPRAFRVPLVVTITADGRVVPPSLRGDVARRFPRVRDAFRRVRSPG